MNEANDALNWLLDVARRSKDVETNTFATQLWKDSKRVETKEGFAREMRAFDWESFFVRINSANDWDQKRHEEYIAKMKRWDRWDFNCDGSCGPMGPCICGEDDLPSYP